MCPRTIVVDAHCDSLLKILEGTLTFSKFGEEGHLDFPRMQAGGVKVQMFAAFIHPRFRFRALNRAAEIIDVYHEDLLAIPGLQHVTNAAQILTAIHQGQIACLLSIEGGEALEGSLANLRLFYRLGVRSLTLTWNGRNEIGDGVGEGPDAGGLSRFGHEVVSEMNRLGMIIDVSHLAEPGFWDVVKTSRQPIIASHANCRMLCDHPRNLSDSQIAALAAQGGVIGVTFVPDFVDPEHPGIDRLLDHIEHLLRVGGEDCPALGSDFDGFDGALPGLEDVSHLPSLTQELVKRGYSARVIEKILGGNLMRVFTEVLK